MAKRAYKTRKKSDRPLNRRQIKFIEVYAGNKTEAARLAGYSGNENTLAQTGFQLLRHPKIKAAIRARESKENRSHIATRKDRQKFWTNAMNNSSCKMGDRLKASELLGRSEADFTEKHEVTGKDGGPQVILTLPANGSEKSENE